MATEKPALRAVKADETPENPRRIELLRQKQRIEMAFYSDKCPPRDLAALARRLDDIADKLEAIDLADEQDGASGGNEVEDGAFDASAV